MKVTQPQVIEFFLLQDLVNDDRSAVTFFMPFNDFKPPSVPKDGDTYREFRRRSIEFIQARSRRSADTLLRCGENRARREMPVLASARAVVAVPSEKSIRTRMTSS